MIIEMLQSQEVDNDEAYRRKAAMNADSSYVRSTPNTINHTPLNNQNGIVY